METTINLEPILERALAQAVSPTSYENLLAEHAANGRTSGSDQTESLINYTKLNAHRSKRVSKTVQLNEELAAGVRDIHEKQTWILITETWCGDAASIVPIIMKVAELNPLIDLRIVFRDSNLELMDQFLTNGGRSIPKLIAVDSSNEVLFDWGPRPQDAQQLFYEWKDSEGEVSRDQFHVDLQQWYNTDKGRSLQRELLEVILGVEQQ